MSTIDAQLSDAPYNLPEVVTLAEQSDMAVRVAPVAPSVVDLVRGVSSDEIN